MPTSHAGGCLRLRRQDAEERCQDLCCPICTSCCCCCCWPPLLPLPQLAAPQSAPMHPLPSALAAALCIRQSSSKLAPLAAGHAHAQHRAGDAGTASSAQANGDTWCGALGRQHALM
eukprot:scaffold193964_cov24-Tisochrysis_lutea.AAC.2